MSRTNLSVMVKNKAASQQPFDGTTAPTSEQYKKLQQLTLCRFHSQTFLSAFVNQ